MNDAVVGGTQATRAVSRAFLRARQQARPLEDFPGALPRSLKDAYAIQDLSIAAWPEDVAGWKVGMVPEPYRDQVEDIRLAGPIFKPSVRAADGAAPVVMGVYEGGFGAVEAEVLVRMGADAPAGEGPLSLEEVKSLVEAMHVGAEIASSPLGAINELGPMSIISDFGNNAGMIVGPEIRNWREIPMSDVHARVYIDGELVGEAPASAIAGGPLSAVIFLIDNLRKRGRVLRAGDWVSTGAVTGVHDVAAGSHSRVDFGACGAIAIDIEPIRPQG